MRDIALVIEELLAEIPASEADMRSALQDISYRALYTAPEIMGHLWQEGTEVVNQHLPAPDDLNHWQRRVVSVWTGQTA